MSKKCRICFCSDEPLSSLAFHKVAVVDEHASKKEINLLDIYEELAQIKYEPTEWEWICEECQNKLIGYYKFRQLCRKSAQEINILLNDVKNEGIPDLDDDNNSIEEYTESLKIDYDSEGSLSCNDTSYRLEDAESSNDQSDDLMTKKKQKNVSKPTSGYLVCSVCSKKFFKQYRLDAHMRIHSGLKQWSCDYCDKSFAKHDSLKQHIDYIHYDLTGERPIFICDICSKVFIRKETLRFHMRDVHVGKKPPKIRQVCEQCGKVFSSYDALRKHSFTHTKITPHKCHHENCGKMFATGNKLKEHLMRHDGIKNFVCPTCGIRKTTRHELRSHMKNHDPNSNAACDLCDKVFTQKQNLRRHKNVVHFGMRPYPCTHCGQAFGKAATLKHHIMTHTGERPYECEYCKVRFIQSVALKKHLKTHKKK